MQHLSAAHSWKPSFRETFYCQTQQGSGLLLLLTSGCKTDSTSLPNLIWCAFLWACVESMNPHKANCCFNLLANLQSRGMPDMMKLFHRKLCPVKLAFSLLCRSGKRTAWLQQCMKDLHQPYTQSSTAWKLCQWHAHKKAAFMINGQKLQDYLCVLCRTCTQDCLQPVCAFDRNVYSDHGIRHLQHGDVI